MGERDWSNFVFFLVFGSALIVGGWLVVVVWSRKSCLGPAEITFFVFLVLFKDGGRRVSPRYHLFVSDVNQGIKDAGWVQDFLAWPQEWTDPPYIFRELLKIENILWK